jgi:hypothetical protein
MSADERQYVAGYTCLVCRWMSNGIEIRSDYRTIAGYRHRVPISPELAIQCGKCGSDVPRENWRLAKCLE